MIRTKVMTASFVAPIYAWLLAWLEIVQSPGTGTFLANVPGFLLLQTIYLVYSFPIFLTYGLLSSWISDKLANRFSSEQVSRIVSFILHMLFGLILSWLSVLAAILFFMMNRLIDRWLIRRKIVLSKQSALKSLGIPVGWCLLLVSAVYVSGVIQDFFQRVN